MANYHEHKCFTCGQIFDYCGRCVLKPIIYKAEGFCSEKCSDIFATLSKHGCNLITADEALEELLMQNIDESKLIDSISAHIERIISEATIKVETPAEQAGTVVTDKQSDKNKKKEVVK